jgi:hypothetical protein
MVEVLAGNVTLLMVVREKREREREREREIDYLPIVFQIYFIEGSIHL